MSQMQIRPTSSGEARAAVLARRRRHARFEQSTQGRGRQRW